MLSLDSKLHSKIVPRGDKGMKKDEDRKGMEVTNPPKVGKTDSDF
jgi:hypothetical protein